MVYKKSALLYGACGDSDVPNTPMWDYAIRTDVGLAIRIIRFSTSTAMASFIIPT